MLEYFSSPRGSCDSFIHGLSGTHGDLSKSFRSAETQTPSKTSLNQSALSRFCYAQLTHILTNYVFLVLHEIISLYWRNHCQVCVKKMQFQSGMSNCKMTNCTQWGCSYLFRVNLSTMRQWMAQLSRLFSSLATIYHVKWVTNHVKCAPRCAPSCQLQAGHWYHQALSMTSPRVLLFIFILWLMMPPADYIKSGCCFSTARRNREKEQGLSFQQVIW